MSVLRLRQRKCQFKILSVLCNRALWITRFMRRCLYFGVVYVTEAFLGLLNQLPTATSASEIIHNRLGD